MQGSARIFRLAATALALLAGCATSYDVRVDSAHDFSGDRSWDWGGRSTRVVDATPGDEIRLDNLTARSVAGALARGGRVQVGVDPDLLVGFELDVTRERVAVNETGAIYLLSSHDSSPSFLVQSTEQRIETYHRGLLRIDVTDHRSGRVVWRGELRTRIRGDLDDTLRETIPELLARLGAPALPSATAGALELASDGH